VDAAAADNAQAVYRHLRSRGFDWLQFIPCLDPLGEEPGGRPWSLSPAAYARFLKTTFDLRYDEWRRGSPVNVRWFDNLVAMAMGGPPESCGMSGSCSVNFTVEADGSVYPCDFYVTDEWRLGNLRDSSFAAMRDSAAARRFVESSRCVDDQCRSCFAFPLCRGGCPPGPGALRGGENPSSTATANAFKRISSAYAEEPDHGDGKSGGRSPGRRKVESQAGRTARSRSLHCRYQT
jgi:uncharacterized protein